MDLDWAEEQCELLVLLVQRSQQAMDALTTTMGAHGTQHREPALARLNEQAEIVRLIAEQVAPHTLVYFDSIDDVRKWAQLAGKVVGAVRARRDYADRLGPTGPVLEAWAMHPKVWAVVSAYWDTGMYDDAVEAAAKVVRAEARAKVGKADLEESAVGDLFSKEPPSASMPCLRFLEIDRVDTATWTAMQTGALMFTKGAFMALRNPRVHPICLAMSSKPLRSWPRSRSSLGGSNDATWRSQTSSQRLPVWGKQSVLCTGR